MNRYFFRRTLNGFMLALTGLCTLAAVSMLLIILGFLVWNGASSLNWNFLTQLPKPTGETGGGFANALVGSAQLVLIATLIGAPIGFLAGVYLSEFSGSRFAFTVRYVTDILNGVPSIVLGLFAYTLIVLPMKHFSGLAGGVALSVIFIPLAVRTTEQFLQAVPQSLREGALALGATKWRSVATVVIPAAGRGILTGMMLGVARIAGETAPLLFTSFNNRFWSTGLDQPVASLPVMIYTYAISPYKDLHSQAWAAGLLLLGLVLFINITGRLILARSTK
jgi:phosphate transport system permease protein